MRLPLLGNPAGLHLLLMASWERWKMGELICFLHSQCLGINKCTLISRASDSSSALLSSSAAEKLASAGRLLTVSCVLLGKQHFASASRLPSLPRPQKNPVE